MSGRGVTRFRPAVAIGLSLLVALVALNIFIYSPWHRHNRLPGQTCSFSSFEHAFGLEASPGLCLEPPAVTLAQQADRQTPRPCAAGQVLHPGRAPPV